MSCGKGNAFEYCFGMGNTLITFEDKYFEYDGDRDVNDKGLTIGG
jgi:hypothetical protein